MLQNSSTLGRTLAAPRLVVQIEEAQKLVQLEAQVWISSDLGFAQSGKSTPLPLVVEKANSVAWIFVLVSKNYFWLSRRDGTNLWIVYLQ